MFVSFVSSLVQALNNVLCAKDYVIGQFENFTLLFSGKLFSFKKITEGWSFNFQRTAMIGRHLNRYCCYSQAVRALFPLSD